MREALTIDQQAARRFIRRATGLDAVASLAAMVQHLGYVQLDPLNVCGRMHDLILRNRVHGYAPGALLDWIHGTGAPSAPPAARQGFEHYLPGRGILVAWPATAYPYIRAYLDRQSVAGGHRQLARAETELAAHILEQVTERGALTSDDIAHDGRALTAWGTNGRMAKVVLEKLFWRGELLITARRGFRRVYDLPSRVAAQLPALPPPDDETLAKWVVLQSLKQRRLVTLRAADAALLGSEVASIRIGGTRVYCLREDLPLLDQEQHSRDAGGADVQLLAPLDPIIYDRKLALAIWDFDFRWEVYTPPASRKRGYYSLPVLAGLEIIGDVEPRADWERSRLSVRSRRVRRGHSVRPAIAELARFLGLRPSP